MTEAEQQIKIATSSLLLVIAKNISESQSSFSVWFLAGCGAAFTFLFANFNSIEPYLNASNVSLCIILYLSALFCGAIQRFLHSIIISSYSAGKEAEKLASLTSLGEQGEDVYSVLDEVIESTYFPTRYFVRKLFDKIKAGDYSASGRMVYKVAQLNTWLAGLIIVLIISSVLVLVW